MAIYNFSYPDIPYMESREMYEYFLLLDKTIRTMGEAINTVSSIDPETIAKLVMPKADGLTIRDTDNVWSVVRAPSANIATEADHAISADSANHATLADNAANAAYASTAGSADKLTNPRTISLEGDITGSSSFDGSQNIVINTTHTEDMFKSISDSLSLNWLDVRSLPVQNITDYDFTPTENGYVFVTSIGSGVIGNWSGVRNKTNQTSLAVFPCGYSNRIGCGGLYPVKKGDTYTLIFSVNELESNRAFFVPQTGVV